MKPSGSLWLIGKLVGIVPVARAYAHATAAIDGATPSSPAPPGSPVVGGITITSTSRRRVPLPRVVGVVPAALQEVPVLEVQAVGERLGDPVHHPAHHLRLQPERIDRQADVDGAHGLGHARAR